MSVKEGSELEMSAFKGREAKSLYGKHCMTMIESKMRSQNEAVSMSLLTTLGTMGCHLQRHVDTTGHHLQGKQYSESDVDAKAQIIRVNMFRL